MTAHKPMTPADHIARAKSILGVVNPNAAEPQHDCEYDDPNKCAWPGHRR